MTRPCIVPPPPRHDSWKRDIRIALLAAAFAMAVAWGLAW